jgi:hypothetical protein
MNDHLLFFLAFFTTAKIPALKNITQTEHKLVFIVVYSRGEKDSRGEYNMAVVYYY